MSIKEQMGRALDNLTDSELQEVAVYPAFVEFRSRTHPISRLNATQPAALYAECADAQITCDIRSSFRLKDCRNDGKQSLIIDGYL